VRAKITVAAALVAVGGLWLAAPANASIDGPCKGSAVVTPDGGGATVAIDPASSDGPYTVPLAGTAAYDGSISGVPAGKQSYSGEVVLELPPGLPDVPVADWSGTSDQTAKKGDYHYDVPSFVPKGIELPVAARHTQGGVHCSAHVTVQFDGSVLNVWTVGAGILAAATGFGFFATAVSPLLRLRTS